MDALAKAHAVRLGNAAVKARVASLSRPEAAKVVAEMLRTPGGPADAMVPAGLLCAIPRVGSTHAQTLLDAAAIPIDALCRVRDLDPIERDRLAGEVEAVVDRVPASRNVAGSHARVKLDRRFGTPFDQLVGRTA